MSVLAEVSTAHCESNLFLLVSTPDDYIGRGLGLETADPFPFSGSNNLASASAFGFTFAFAAPGQQSLAVGVYDNARQLQNHGSAPGIDISGNGRACGQECGSFQILELHTDLRRGSSKIIRQFRVS